MTRDEIIEYNEDAILCDGFDEAIVGMSQRINLGPIVTYDVNKIIEILMVRDGMTYEESYEFFEYNILGSWMGENTPIFLYTK